MPDQRTDLRPVHRVEQVTQTQYDPSGLSQTSQTQGPQVVPSLSCLHYSGHPSRCKPREARDHQSQGRAPCFWCLHCKRQGWPSLSWCPVEPLTILTCWLHLHSGFDLLFPAVKCRREPCQQDTSEPLVQFSFLGLSQQWAALLSGRLPPSTLCQIVFRLGSAGLCSAAVTSLTQVPQALLPPVAQWAVTNVH